MRLNEFVNEAEASRKSLDVLSAAIAAHIIAGDAIINGNEVKLAIPSGVVDWERVRMGAAAILHKSYSSYRTAWSDTLDDVIDALETGT